MDKYQISQQFPDKEINTAWENDLQVGGVAFGEGKWVMLTQKAQPEGLQRWATNPEFPSEEIKTGWDGGYDITYLAYAGDRWIVIQNQQSGFTDQIWRTSSQFPQDEINKHTQDGYVITQLTYGTDRWAVVMSKGHRMNAQTIITSTEFPEEAIKKGWDEGRDITSFARGDGKWALVMSKNTGSETQSWALRNSFDEALIAKKFSAGNQISELAFAGDQWLFVFTKFPQINEAGSKSANTSTAQTADADTFSPQAVDEFEKGKELSQKDQNEKAVAHFRKAIQLEPEYYSAYNSLGVVLDVMGEKREALECFQKAYQFESHDSIILSNLISQMAEIGESSEAISTLVESADTDTVQHIGMVSALIHIADAYLEQNKPEKAIGYLTLGENIEKDNSDIKERKTKAAQLVDKELTSLMVPEGEMPSPSEDLESLLRELDDLTGLEDIKRDVDDLIKFIKVEKKRRERGIAVGSTTLHTVFAGPPGTGKTTVARLMGRFFKATGLLKKGHVIEVDRSGLVGEFVGQTAIKTNKVIDSAIDGILFIDEAYSLVPSDTRNDFGEEAVNTLVKRMEDHKHNLIVIVAGYTDEMKRFITSNPGLQHRFTRYFNFKDYTPEQLTAIFESICSHKKFILTEEAKAKVCRYFDFLYRSKTKRFGNARAAVNQFEEVVRLQSARLALMDVDKLSDKDLLTIVEDDITESVKDEFDDKHVETLDEIMHELNNLVGLDEIKQSISTLVNLIKTRQKLAAIGRESESISLHSVFFGPPGTGKTTVARLIGRIYKALGLLPLGHVIEANRADLVGEFIGHTAPKTHKVIDSALHGVLFVDEAYTLASSQISNDFGHEAIATLLKRMEDERDQFAVILAGYPQEMKMLIASNTGLESRFNNYYHFSDYSPQELTNIFIKMIEQRKFNITAEALTQAATYFEQIFDERTASFGNGRAVRNFYEKMVKAYSNRIAGLLQASEEELTTYTLADVKQAVEMTHTFTGNESGRKPVGF